MHYYILIVRGLPGSGKTTWASEQINLDQSLILVDDPSVLLRNNLNPFVYAFSELKKVSEFNSLNANKVDYKLLIADPEFTSMSDVEILKYLNKNLNLSKLGLLNDVFLSIVDIDRDINICREKCVHSANMTITRLSKARVESDIAIKIIVNDLIVNDKFDNINKCNWVGNLNYNQLEYHSFSNLLNKFNVNLDDADKVLMDNNYTIINNRIIKLR